MGIFLPDMILQEGELEDGETVLLTVPKSFL